MPRIDQAVAYFNDTFGANSVSLNFGSNANRYVVVWALGSSGVTLTSVSVGGEAALTQYLSETNSLASSRKAAMWAGSVAGTGAKTVQLTVSGSGNLQIMAFAYDGITGVRAGSAQKGYANPGNPSLTMTTVAGDICVMMGESLTPGSGTFVATAPAALVFASGTFWIHAEQTATSTSTTIAGTWASGSNSWEAMGLALVPATPPATLSGNTTADDATTGGAGFSSSGSALSGNTTADDAATAGTFGLAPGTVTSLPLKSNNGTVLANLGLTYVDVYSEATGAFVKRLTGLSTDSLGVFTITDTAIVTGVDYKFDWLTAGGHRRMPKSRAT